MKGFLFVVIILNCLNFLVLIQTASFSKYELIIDYLDFPDSRVDNFFNYGSLRVKKYNRTTYSIDGYFEILVNITDDIVLTYEMYALQGNEFRRINDRKNVKNLCAKSQIHKKHFVRYLKLYTDMPTDYECPYPSGRYNVHNAAFSNEYLPFEPPNNEKFRLNVTYSRGAEILCTHAVYYILKKLPPSLKGV